MILLISLYSASLWMKAILHGKNAAFTIRSLNILIGKQQQHCTAQYGM